jgi:energy-coupling factor transport system ATP-binding protein
VEADVAFGPKNQGLSEEEISARVKESLKLVGLDYEKFGHKSPFLLSGGEKRRVAIASVLAMKPELLILDEPFNFLDPSGQNTLKHVLTDYHRETGATIIISSHNLQHTTDISTRILLMEKGRIIADGADRQQLEDYFA